MRSCACLQQAGLEALYKERYDGWSVKHFFERYQDQHRGQRSYTWVKSRLQKSGLTSKAQTPRQTAPTTPTGPSGRHDDAPGRVKYTDFRHALAEIKEFLRTIASFL